MSLVTNDYIKDGKPHILQDKHIPPYVSIIRIHGPFLFGAAAKLEESCPDLSGLGAVVVLRLPNVEQRRQHHSHLYCYCQIGKHRQGKRRSPHDPVRPRQPQDRRDLRPLAHVVRHDHQDPRECRQRRAATRESRYASDGPGPEKSPP